MHRFKLWLAALIAIVSLGVFVPPAAAANNYKVRCWSTTGSPYVETTATSFTSKQAFLNCMKGLVSRRWGSSLCGGWYYSFYGADGYHYGWAQEYPNISICNYSRGSTFNAKGFLESYW